MEKKLLALLKRMAPTKLLLLSTERIEMMILTTGLELIRYAFNTHARGILLGSADRLDHLLNMCRAAITSDVLPGISGFAEAQKSMITVWNDDKEEKREFLRSHLVHHEMIMKIGVGLNVVQKRNWNGINLTGLKITDKELKRRLRVVVFNEEVETVFSEPVFDNDKGTYNLDEASDNYIDALDKPLIPAKKETAKKIIIR